MTNKPLVSCICPTYGRIETDPSMLSEMLQSFLDQDYPNKELIILNDAYSSGQWINCDIDNVRVYNCSYRFPSLGNKYNSLCDLSGGEFILPWEDDDVSLPRRISQAVDFITQDSGYDYWKPHNAFLQVARGPIQLCSESSVHHNASIFRKSAWASDIHYPNIVEGVKSVQQDAVYDQRLRNSVRFNPARVPDNDFQYVYRWQTGSGLQPNLSGYTDPLGQYYNTKKPSPGIYNLVPKWYRDYKKECEECKASLQKLTPITFTP